MSRLTAIINLSDAAKDKKSLGIDYKNNNSVKHAFADSRPNNVIKNKPQKRGLNKVFAYLLAIVRKITFKMVSTK